MPSAAEAGLGDGGEAALLALSQLLLGFEIFGLFQAAPLITKTLHLWKGAGWM